MGDKKIVDKHLPVSELKHDFGNPRKIKPTKLEELKESLSALGNFGVVLIDEDYNIIAGNQRVAAIADEDPDAVVHCKQLIGYTNSELRAINIKDNTHAGDWDLDLLADWTADLTIDLGIEDEKDPEERKIKEMELIHYEKYDYVLLVCRNEIDYANLVNRLGIDGAKVKVTKKRSIRGRAVWYDQVEDRLFGDGISLPD